MLHHLSPTPQSHSRQFPSPGEPALSPTLRRHPDPDRCREEGSQRQPGSIGTMLASPAVSVSDFRLHLIVHDTKHLSMDPDGAEPLNDGVTRRRGRRSCWLWLATSVSKATLVGEWIPDQRCQGHLVRDDLMRVPSLAGALVPNAISTAGVSVNFSTPQSLARQLPSPGERVGGCTFLAEPAPTMVSS